jgi:hypothetical protein
VARLLALLPLLLAPFLAFTVTARAQEDVAGMLRRQRAEVRAAELFGALGGRVAPRPAAYLGQNTIYWLWHDRLHARRQAAADSAAAAAAAARADSLARLPATLAEIRWEKVAPDEQEPFIVLNREVYWVATATPAAVDTIGTPRLRAQLNGLFGVPTRNAAAAEEVGYAGSEFVQFEYWLVVNDTIPLLVLDREGPFGHGLLLAGSEAQRRYLPLLARDLAARLLAARPTPYVDYFHAVEERQWYQTGYDGTEYYTRASRAPRGSGTRTRNERWRIFR